MGDAQPLYDEEVFEPANQKSTTAADPDQWPIMAPAAYHDGLVSEIISTLAPETEADPVALLLQFLVSFGNILGRKPFFYTGAKRHYPVLYALIVGATAKARKGTSAEVIRRVFEVADPDWVRNNIVSGISSGEGIIQQVRDPIYVMKKGEEELADPGINDKRLMIDEREFSSALDNMQRPGNTISLTIRTAWDCPEILGTMTKHSPTKATEAHISIAGHITLSELRRKLAGGEISNGFGNRFLFTCVKRARLLPHGGNLPDEVFAQLGAKTQAALSAAAAFEQIVMSSEAKLAWEPFYRRMSEDTPGLVDELTARNTAQAVRLAMLYALIDGSTQIEAVHVAAAEAVWDFCEASARYIFGDATGDSIDDTILCEVRAAGSVGLSRSQILRDVFGRNVPASKIAAALERLETAGNLRRETQKPLMGRPREMWFAN
jgi:hypothetical protein